MPLEKLECPNCGKKSELSEYRENQYRCIRCGNIFKYHPPADAGQDAEFVLVEDDPCPGCGTGMFVCARRSRVSLYGALMFFVLTAAVILAGMNTGGVKGIVVSVVGGIIFLLLSLGLVLYFFCLTPVGLYYKCPKCGRLIPKI